MAKARSAARVRIDFYIAHEMRLVNEGAAMERLLNSLTDGSDGTPASVLVIAAELKQRFLSR
eukprot:5676982-Prymnesium_polylepis.1